MSTEQQPVWLATLVAALALGSATVRAQDDVPEWARPARGTVASPRMAQPQPAVVDPAPAALNLRPPPPAVPPAQPEPVPAQSPARAVPMAGVLGEAAAVNLALERHPLLQGWQLKARAAGLYAETASPVSMPVLKLGVSDAPSDLAGARRKNVVGVEWTPPQPGEGSLRRELADQRSQEARHAADLARDRLVAEVRSAHMAWRVLDAVAAEARQAQRLREQAREVVRAQWQARRRTQAEFFAAELQARDAAQALAALELERDTQATRLRAALAEPGASTSWQLPPATLDMTDDNGPTIALSGDAVLRERADWRAIVARCASLVADTALQEQAGRAWFKDVQVSRSVEEGGKPTQWELQMNVYLPVTGPRNGSPAVMQSQRAACEAERQALELQIGQEHAESIQRLAAARRDWLEQQRGILPLQEGALRSARAAREAGRLDEGELIAAELRAVEARQVAWRRQLAWRQAEIAAALVQGRVLTLAPAR